MWGVRERKEFKINTMVLGLRKLKMELPFTEKGKATEGENSAGIGVDVVGENKRLALDFLSQTSRNQSKKKKK